MRAATVWLLPVLAGVSFLAGAEWRTRYDREPFVIRNDTDHDVVLDINEHDAGVRIRGRERLALEFRIVSVKIRSVR